MTLDALSRRSLMRGLVVTATQVAGDAHEDLGAPVRGKWILERARCGVDCASRLGGATLRDTADDVSRVRGANVEPGAGLGPLAVDQQLPLGRRRGHAASVREAC